MLTKIIKLPSLFWNPPHMSPGSYKWGVDAEASKYRSKHLNTQNRSYTEEALNNNHPVFPAAVASQAGGTWYDFVLAVLKWVHAHPVLKTTNSSRKKRPNEYVGLYLDRKTTISKKRTVLFKAVILLEKNFYRHIILSISSYPFYPIPTVCLPLYLQLLTGYKTQTLKNIYAYNWKHTQLSIHILKTHNIKSNFLSTQSLERILARIHWNTSMVSNA